MDTNLALEKDTWFRLKHRNLPTKDNLKRWGVIQEDLCSLCGHEKESLEHLFITCEKHLDAWALVEHLIQKYTNDYTFTLSDKTRILGTGVKNSLCLLLIGKLHSHLEDKMFLQ